MKYRIRVVSIAASIILLAALLFYAVPAVVSTPAIDVITPTIEKAVESAAVSELGASVAPESYTVSLDVNPSIELVITEGVVTAVKTYNDDGSAVVLGVELENKTAEEAVKLLVAAMVDQGYIVQGETDEDKSYLVVTVSNGDNLVAENAAELLEAAAETVLTEKAVECDVQSAYVPDELASEAADLGVSTGRYVMLKAAMEKEGIEIDEAIDTYGSMKINALMKLFPEAKEALKEYNKSMTQDEEDVEPEIGDGDSGAEALEADETNEMAEQDPAFKEALDNYHAAIKAAKAAFFLAMDDVKSNLKIAVKDLEKPKGKEGQDVYKSDVAALRNDAKVAQKKAIEDMKAAIKAAQLDFRNAKIALGMIKGDIEAVAEETAELEEETPEEIVEETIEEVNLDPFIEEVLADDGQYAADETADEGDGLKPTKVKKDKKN